MKYIIAILVALSVGGYFAYQKADGYYEARVSGELRVMFNKYDMVQFDSGDVQANFKAGTVKTKWENAWDAWPALAVGALCGIVVFGGLFLTTADKLVNAELNNEIKRLKRQLQREKERADNAQSDARKEFEQDRSEAQKLQKQADSKFIEAENRIRNAEQEKQRYIEQAKQVVKQREQQAKQAQSDAQQQSTRKEHASAAMQRYKRKLDKLKTDDHAIIQFVKKHHADLLQNAD